MPIIASAFHEPRSLVLLGSTGSVGTQAIDVIERDRDRFRVKAISAGGGNLETLARQAPTLGMSWPVMRRGGRGRRRAGSRLAARRSRPPLVSRVRQSRAREVLYSWVHTAFTSVYASSTS
ncbi:hypothetical protein AB0L65_42290 [Nonomuraea sp. NPDC052116]|uniref:hypothetical protein n=1 Tax=Nonomuraea sp. NPDC052116 TaxID=3155665 RepID=UPI003431A5E0